MGLGTSSLEKKLGDKWPQENFFGFENVKFLFFAKLISNHQKCSTETHVTAIRFYKHFTFACLFVKKLFHSQIKWKVKFATPRFSPFTSNVFKHQFKKRKKKGQTSSTEDETILSVLSELFKSYSMQKHRTGIIEPRKFITKLRKETGTRTKHCIILFNHEMIFTVPFLPNILQKNVIELFRGTTQQDAHEFLNYLLNTVSENLQKLVSRVTQKHL